MVILVGAHPAPVLPSLTQLSTPRAASTSPSGTPFHSPLPPSTPFILCRHAWQWRGGGERERWRGGGERETGIERERERENIIDRYRDDDNNDNDKVSLLLAPHIHNSLSVSSRCCQGGKPPWDPHSPHHWDWQTPTTHRQPTLTLDPNLNTSSAHRDYTHIHTHTHTQTRT